jgi:hypothetical protein
MMRIRDHFANYWNSEDLLDSLWRICASPYTTALLLVLLAAAVCLGVVLPQRPAEALDDPRANSLWLTSLRERYRSMAEGLLALGLVDVYHSLWFRALLGLFTLNLLLGAVDLVRPRLPLRKTSNTRTLNGVLSPAELPAQLLTHATQVLRGRRYRFVGGSSEAVMYADRFVLYRLLVYVGVLLVIGGLVVSERTAWWEEDFVLGPRQVRPLDHGSALAVRAQVLGGNDSGNSDQSLNGLTELTFVQADREVGRTVLRDRIPSFYAGLLFRPTATEPALLVKAQASSGRHLGLQTPETGGTEFREVTLRFREDESPRYIVALGLTPGNQLGRQFEQKENERYVLVPSRNLTLRLLYHPSQPGEAAPSFQAEAFRPNETLPFSQHQFSTASLVEIEGDRYTFEPQRYAVIKYGQDYGLVLIGLGTVMALLGIGLTAWRPLQRMWLVAQTRNGEASLHLMASTVLRRGTPAWFEDTVESLATALGLSVQRESLDESSQAR